MLITLIAKFYDILPVYVLLTLSQLDLILYYVYYAKRQHDIHTSENIEKHINTVNNM